jgi:outer membrane protein
MRAGLRFVTFSRLSRVFSNKKWAGIWFLPGSDFVIAKTMLRSFLALAFVAALSAQSTPTKVGIINVQTAIISTRDGQVAVKELQDRFNPKQKQLQDLQSEIQSLQQQLQRGSNIMGEEALRKLRQDIDDKQRALQRESEDAQMEFDQQQQRVFAGISQKMQNVIDKYARENGYVLIVDVSSPQSNVLYASNSIDITKDVIAAFDADPSATTGEGGGSAGQAQPSSPAAAPAKP